MYLILQLKMFIYLKKLILYWLWYTLSRKECNPSIWKKNPTKNAILENRSNYLTN
jgi:hypothetical protein